MVIVDWLCDLCANRLGLVDGWHPACKAFPEGIPGRFAPTPKGVDVTTIPECANGFKFIEGPNTESKA